MTFCPSCERQICTKKYDNLKLVNLVQTNEILLIKNSTHLNIRFEIFGWICMYIYIDRIWRWMTYRGWCAIKPKQPPNQHFFFENLHDFTVDSFIEKFMVIFICAYKSIMEILRQCLKCLLFLTQVYTILSQNTPMVTRTLLIFWCEKVYS